MSEINISIVNVGIHKIIKLDRVELMVFENGDVFRKSFNKWKLIKNVDNCNGYNVIGINGKMILRHRIIAHTFLNLDINDVKQVIDHINGDKLNNSLINLRIVTQQQNLFNNHVAKGYFFDKRCKKFRAVIGLNGKQFHLGYFMTEEEAKAAYQAAKLIYHIIE